MSQLDAETRNAKRAISIPLQNYAYRLRNLSSFIEKWAIRIPSASDMLAKSYVSFFGSLGMLHFSVVVACNIECTFRFSVLEHIAARTFVCFAEEHA